MHSVIYKVVSIAIVTILSVSYYTSLNKTADMYIEKAQKVVDLYNQRTIYLDSLLEEF